MTTTQHKIGKCEKEVGVGVGKTSGDKIEIG